jgi:hypothetical protein
MSDTLLVLWYRPDTKLRRNLKVRNETTKEIAYKAIVRSNLEYYSTVYICSHHIPKRTKMNWKEYRGEQHALYLVDTITQATYPT